MRVCVCVCARCACVRACVCVGFRARGRVHGRMRVALLIQHAIRMRHILSSFVASLAPPCFSTSPHKQHDFQKNVIELNVCFYFLYSFV